jgi:tetratricopeptide (TPR) repeat protein
MAALNDLTSMADPVTRALQRIGTPEKSNKSIDAMTQESLRKRIQTGEMAREELPSLAIEKQKQAEESFTEQAGLRTEAAKRKKELGEEFAFKARELSEAPEYRQKEVPIFEPSVASVEDLQNVMGLSIVAGLLVGGATKRAGNLGLVALNGAMEGFRQGRQDVFKRELDVFGKQVDAIKENNKLLLERFNRAMSLLETDRKAAEGELAVLEAETANSVAKGLLAQGRYSEAEKLFRDAVATGDKAADFKLRMQEKAQAAALALQQKQSIAAQNFVLKLAEFNRKVEQDQAKTTSLGAEEKKQLRGLDNLKSELEDLQRIALQNPDKFFGFGTDAVGNVVAGYREKVLKDPEMSSFIRRFEAFQIPERHDKFGATLTGNERESWRKSIIGPGNDPSAVTEYFTTKLMILDRARNNIINNPYRSSAPADAQAQLGTAAQQAVGMGVNLGPLGSMTFQPPARQPAQTGLSSSDIASHRAEANDAIRRGAPRDAVARKFKENTGQEL